MGKRLYFIAGPNGAGKTTASFTILPELWQCREFVNADEIARGLSPFHPEEVAIEAARLQLERINRLLDEGVTFSIETTLATRSYTNLIKRAHEADYEVELLFFYLPSAEHAKERVRLRVLSGGHDIPEDVIRRRYESGLSNLFQIYMPLVDSWSIYNNEVNPSQFIANNCYIKEIELFQKMKEKYGNN